MRDTRVDLIRHGEPVGGRRYRGNGTDDPLSPLGWEQMRQAVGDAGPWDQVITSPLARCRAFAVEMASRHGLPLAVEPDLREIGMGEWEGRTHEEVQAAHPQAYAAMYRDPVANRPPGGEPLASLAERVGRAYDLAVAGHPGRRLLIVAHAGVMRAVVGRTLGADPRRWYRIRFEFAGVVRICHDRFGPSLEYVNARRLR